MRMKLVISLLAAGISYIITVLACLILQLSLLETLTRGLMAFITFLSLSWLVLIIIEVLSRSEKKAVQEDSSETTKEEEEDGFKPMQPPVLEVEEDGEQNREL